MQFASNYLFVYGTLMQESKNEMSQFLATHSQFIDYGYLIGKLYKVADFPGAVLSNNIDEKVFGAVYELKDSYKVFKVLDVYEGIDKTSLEPDLYKRLLINVFLENNTTLNCWVYIYNFPVDSLKHIPSGRYKSSI